MVKCQVCGGKVNLREFQDQELTTCMDCGGHFLGANDFRHVVEHRYNEKGGRRKDKGETISCMLCKHDMHIVNYGGDSGIMIRKCDECDSIWLAKGQAAAIYDYLHDLKKYDRKVNEMQIELSKTAHSVDEELKKSYKKYR